MLNRELKILGLALGLLLFLFSFKDVNIKSDDFIQGFKYQESHSFDSETAQEIIQNRIFYFLTVIHSNNGFRKQVIKNKFLSNIKKQKIQSIENVLENSNSPQAWVKSALFNEEEIHEIGNELVAIYSLKKRNKDLLTDLKDSKKYINFEYLEDTAFIRKCWESDIKGINRILRVYMGGEKPHYAIIDSMSFNINDMEFKEQIKSVIQKNTIQTRDKSVLSLFLNMAVETLVKVNGRDEAARYFPKNEGYNASSYEEVRKIDWSRYKYSAILTPGFGPDEPGIRLSERGKARCIAAVERYNKGIAPFIITSGGHAYPFRTPYAEAVEMKKFMVEQLEVPENAVIVEPYARHTTTNLRNAVRIIYEFGLPAEKPMMIVTDSPQTAMIKNLDIRCVREMGFVPYQRPLILNNEESTILPAISAFHINAMDPLDP